MSGERLSIALAKTKARLYGRAVDFRPAVSTARVPADEGRWAGSEAAEERGRRVEGVATQVYSLVWFRLWWLCYCSSILKAATIQTE